MSEKELIPKINEIAPDGRRYKHSYFQLQYFVIGKEPTIQGRIQSCKTELLSRKDDIEGLSNELEELIDRKRLEEIEIEELRKAEELSEVHQIRIRQHRRRILAIDKKIEDFNKQISAKEDEANFLIGLYEKLCEKEAERDWEDLHVQAEYWNAKLTREIESRLMIGQLPNIEDIKTVMAMPPGLPIKEMTDKLIAVKSEEIKKLKANDQKSEDA